MAEATPYNLDAVRDDGFMDFYELMLMPQDATARELQDRMAALNSEALANSDHRNLNKRRDYQALREYIPQARSILLDPAKRALYDDYAAQARNGSAPSSFSTFMGQMAGQISDEERTDVLGVQDKRGSAKNTPATARSGASLPTASSTRPTPSNTGGASGGVARRQPQVSPGAKSGPPIAIIAVIAVIVLALILLLVLKH